ncbi:MAG: co-chaperone GroES [Planctomycetota bacterium]
MAKIQPLNDHVAVRPNKSEEKTAGGILLPDMAKEKPLAGKVLAVGQGKTVKSGKRIPLDVRPGDEVLFGKYSGHDVRMGDEEIKILRSTDILGVLEK